MRFILILFIFLPFIGCQSPPTKVFESGQGAEKSGEKIPRDVLVIDARPAFEYAISHLPGSLNMRWEDLAQKTEPYKGLLEKDLYFHARRLARYGISPKRKILMIGRGHQGKGEEGRLAWTFRVMGITNVTTKSIDAFSVPLTKQESPPFESVPIWKPELDLSLVVEKDVFLKDIMRPHGSKDYPVVIDVRSEAEYLGKDTSSYYSTNAPDLNAINIPFTEFLSEQGEVQPSIKEKLEAVGITSQRKIYVIDELGVRSAAVTLALREIGYTRAANFAGGYMYLMGR